MLNLVVVLILGFFAWQISAEPRGRLAAEIDLSLGRHKVIQFGHEKEWTGEYRVILKQRFGIETEIDNSSKHQYADGYNSVSFEAAYDRYGDEVFTSLWREVEERWQKSKR